MNVETYLEENYTDINEVFDSYINGNFVQARGELHHILQSGRNAILESEETRLEAGVDHEYCEGFDLWVAVETAKYLANTPSLEVRQAVQKWEHEL